MPFKNLLKNIVSTAFDHVTMTWNYSVEVPASNLLCALIEILTISRACNMPKESLLPCRRSRCILESNEYLRQYAGRWIFASPRELFVRWEVEHHTEIKSRNQSSNFMRGFRIWQIISKDYTLKTCCKTPNLVQKRTHGLRRYILRLYQCPVTLVKKD